MWRHQTSCGGRPWVLTVSDDSSVEFLACAPPFLSLLDAHPAMGDARRGG